jgi:hypothetical protein
MTFLTVTNSIKTGAYHSNECHPRLNLSPPVVAGIVNLCPLHGNP